MQLFQAAAEEAAVTELPVHPGLRHSDFCCADVFAVGYHVATLRSTASEAPASTDVSQPQQGSTSANH